MKNLSLFFCFAFLLYGTVLSRSLIIYVDDDAPGILSGEEYIHDGSTWESAYTTLQEALDIVIDDPGAYWKIYVAGGTYKPTTTSIPGVPRSACFKMYNNAEIYGSFAKIESGPEERTNASMLANESILSGDIDGIDGFSEGDCYHVIYNTSDLALTNSAMLDGFTIKGGNANNGDMIDAIHYYGGGMYNEQASPAIANCTFISNRANDFGGGMYNCSSSSPIITNCIFAANEVWNWGGGMHNDNSSPTITNCLFTSNSADYGGGMYNINFSNVTLTNCTFTSNSGNISGGGISNYESSLTLNNCIVWGNTASTAKQLEIAGGNTTLNYSCYGNASEDVVVTSGSFVPDGNCITIDPKFVSNIFYTGYPHSITGISPCKNTGNNSYNSETYDIRGQARIQNGTIDMGAYEWTNGLDIEKRVVHVNHDAVGGLNNGTNWTNAFTSLQSALNAAISGDEIWVAAGGYRPSQDYDLGDESNPRLYHFRMINGVAIYGGFAGVESSISERSNYSPGEINETLLIGDLDNDGLDDHDSYHVFYHPTSLGLTSSAVLDGFTITGGNANGSSPHISGGGMFNRTCSPTILNCNFISNSASSSGGGMYNRLNSPILTNCTFTSNSANSGGGGLYNDGSSPTITNCVFTSNSAVSSGGGMNNSSSSSIVTNCLFISNSANYGGGLNISSSSPTISNCTFTSNSGGTYGGGIYISFSSPTINNCIIWGNTAVTYGNQIYKLGAGTLTLNFCCYGNEDSDVFYDDIFTPDHCINTDPKFVSAAINPVHPYSIMGESSCADAGSNDYITEGYDLRGSSFPRKLNKLDGTAGIVDIGAYEYKFGEDPLPVELTSFTASVIINGIELKWQTATEVNNYGFEVERQVGSKQNTVGNQNNLQSEIQNLQWEWIGFVEGSGNSNSPKQYSFVDPNPPSGNLQYRLKQIDTDGSFNYYNEIAEVIYSLTGVEEKQFPTEFGLSQNYPNPFNPSTVISYQLPASLNPSQEGTLIPVTLKVYDLLGKEVATLVNDQWQPGYYNVKFDGRSLASGIYIYRLNAGNFTSTKKLILMK